jgi:hypothetical protein
MKQKDTKVEMKENKRKEEVKLHYLKTPLLGQWHHIRGRFLQRNPQQGRRRVLISPS